MKHYPEIQAALPEFGRVADERVDRQQVVAPIELRAMTGVVEHGHLGLAVAGRGTESVDRGAHGLQSSVGLELNRETGLAQEFGHRSRVGDRILQW